MRPLRLAILWLRTRYLRPSRQAALVRSMRWKLVHRRDRLLEIRDERCKNIVEITPWRNLWQR